MSDDQNREIFLEEAYDLLAELEASLLELEQCPRDKDLVNKVFRALHTIKGSGAMFGFDDIAAFSHSLENVFDRVRNDKIVVCKDLITVSFAARDQILGMLSGPDEHGNGTPEKGAEILVRVAQLLEVQAAMPDGGLADQEACVPVPDPELGGDGDQAATGVEVCYRLRIRPRDRSVGKELRLDSLFDSLRELGPCIVRQDRRNLPELEALEPQTLYLDWEVDLTTSQGEEAIRDQFFFTDVDLDVDIQVVGLDATPDWLETKDHVADQAAAAPAIAFDGPLPETAPMIGEILIQEGVLREDDLKRALDQQKPIGKILTESGLVTQDQIDQAVLRQQQTREAIAQQHARETATPRAAKDVGTSLRVAAEKLDLLVDLVGELVIVQSQISQTVNERSDPALTVLSEQLERLSSDLRDSTLGIRMLPIGSTFSKFRRLVRDLSGELGKQIDLVTRGEETELDKTVLERLGDPLVHLIRNSIDHGIGLPQERKAVGKSPAGRILLEAEHSGSEVLIRISDDGKGMDTQAIRAKAVERGLISAEVELSQHEILKLIFLPGFSTAASVTNISGRGVGMDVVQRAIDALRGAIEIESAKGQGTTITIRLPLTLAIIEGLQVQVAGEFYVIPLSVVEECVELLAQDVEQGGRQRMIHLRGELVPYVHLRHWFQLGGTSPDIEQIVITGVEGRRVGIVVDRVVGEHQTVIKSLGRVYRDVEGISGATIKGDGTLALILDVPRLVRAVLAETTN